jgi:hypothetical protein
MRELENRFELDVSRNVYNDLTDDPMSYINDRLQEFYGCKQGKIICGVADILYATSNNELAQEKMFCSAAFIAGGAVVMSTLLESDLEKTVISKVQKQLLYSRVPSAVIKDSPEETDKTFKFLSLAGFVSHQEIRPHSEIVGEYFKTLTSNEKCMKAAIIGSGFTALLIDTALQRIEEVEKEKIKSKFNIDLDSVDWDNIQELG